MYKLYYYFNETGEKLYTGIKAFTQKGLEEKITKEFYWTLEYVGIHLIAKKKEKEIWF